MAGMRTVFFAIIFCGAFFLSVSVRAEEVEWVPVVKLSRSLETLRLAAEGGDVDAQYELGYAYMGTKDVPVDYDKAVRWTLLAAERGNARAQYNLGVLYYHV